MNDAAPYDHDIVLWAERQAALLRTAAEAGRDEPIEWTRIAEEIESLGRARVTEVRSHLARIVEHLLKLHFSPCSASRRGWVETVLSQRGELDLVLDDSPSLRARLPELLESVRTRAADRAARSLLLHDEAMAAQGALAHGGRYSLADITGDCLPPEPRVGPLPLPGLGGH